MRKLKFTIVALFPFCLCAEPMHVLESNIESVPLLLQDESGFSRTEYFQRGVELKFDKATGRCVETTTHLEISEHANGYSQLPHSHKTSTEVTCPKGTLSIVYPDR